PIGPGPAGVLNALAVSPDGAWLAFGGIGVMRGAPDFRGVGMVFPSGAKSREAREDEGSIFVVNVDNERDIKVLRGHAGPGLALASVPARAGGPPQLVSAAVESGAAPPGAVAHVRLWDVGTAATLAETAIDTRTPHLSPGLTAWHTGPGAADVRVAV